MAKPVSLTVHRNTLARRRRRQASDSLAREAKELRGDFAGYALVTWREDGSSRCDWFRASVSLNVMPEFVKTALVRSIAKSDCAGLINHAMGFDDPEDAA